MSVAWIPATDVDLVFCFGSDGNLVIAGAEADIHDCDGPSGHSHQEPAGMHGQEACVDLVICGTHLPVARQTDSQKIGPSKAARVVTDVAAVWFVTGPGTVAPQAAVQPRSPDILRQLQTVVITC